MAQSEQLLAPLLRKASVHTTENKQANRIETHQIWCLEVTAEQMGFPFARQIFAIRRIVQPTDKTQPASDEIAYGITSLPPGEDTEANAQTVLSTFRTHWSIEAKCHARRDKSFQEDTCQVRNHNAARILAAFRQMAIFLCEINAHRVRIKKDQRCLPELFRYCALNGIHHALEWFKNPKALTR